MKFLDVLDRCGLMQKEAKEILRVSRQTLRNWDNGTPPKNAFLYTYVEAVCGLLETALDKGKLPISMDYSPVERIIVIKKILAEVRKG